MELPPGTRQARLAAWSTAWLQGRCDVGTAVDAVVGPDALHIVAGVPGESDPLPLAGFLRWLRGTSVTAVRYLPAAPGDVSALPGPADFNAAAVAVGGAVVCVGQVPLGLLPVVQRHGPPGDVVSSVRWQSSAVAPRRLAPVDLREARRLLTEEVQASLASLHELDVARPRAEADALARSWHADAPSRLLPPGCPAEAATLLDRATRLHQVVALGLVDEGGAPSGWEATQRRATLVQLDQVLRHVLADAWNCGLAPAAQVPPVAWPDDEPGRLPPHRSDRDR